MTDSRAALGSDRLPWLADEPKGKPARKPRNDLLAWAVGGALVIAAGSYWLGTRTGTGEAHFADTGSGRPSATVAVPQPLAPAQEREVEPSPMPDANPTPAPEVRPVRERSVRFSVPRARPAPRRILPVDEESPTAREEMERILEAQGAESAPETPPVTIVKPAPKAAPAEKLKPWPATQSAGASGRIVRVGAFGTRLQAKLGWRYMVRSYPAVAHLRATVVEDRNSRGRHFYRFQIGTTSQAHSEVLCQRMERIRLSCAVVGLSWKPKGVER